MRRGWAAVAALALAVGLAVSGCQTDPCHAHGGTKDLLKAGSVYIYECNDGTSVV